MNKNITYNLNESKMREMLQQFSVDFSEENWLNTEKNLDALGLQRKANVRVSGKKLMVFAGLFLLAAGLLAFINYNQRKKENSNPFTVISSQEKNNFAGLNESTGIRVNNDLPKLVVLCKCKKERPFVN